MCQQTKLCLRKRDQTVVLLCVTNVPASNSRSYISQQISADLMTNHVSLLKHLLQPPPLPLPSTCFQKLQLYKSHIPCMTLSILISSSASCLSRSVLRPRKCFETENCDLLEKSKLGRDWPFQIKLLRCHPASGQSDGGGGDDVCPSEIKLLRCQYVAGWLNSADGSAWGLTWTGSPTQLVCT